MEFATSWNMPVEEIIIFSVYTYAHVLLLPQMMSKHFLKLNFNCAELNFTFFVLYWRIHATGDIEKKSTSVVLK